MEGCECSLKEFVDLKPVNDLIKRTAFCSRGVVEGLVPRLRYTLYCYTP